MKVLIDTGNGLQDYSQFIVDGSLTTEDSINVPSLLNFILSANQDNAFIVPKRSSYVKVISDIYAALPATATTSVPLNIQGVGADAGASYSPAQGFPGNTQLAVDPSGNIYASLTMNSVYFGLLAKVSPSGQILATQGDSGTCLICLLYTSDAADE